MKKNGNFTVSLAGKRQKDHDFMRMAWQETRQMRTQRRPKTVYNCLTALRALQRYLESERPGLKGRLPVRCLTSYLMLDFHDWLLSRGVSENSVREYLRSLRSIVNRCARHRLPLRGDLFSRVSTSALPSARQPIGQHDMRRIHEAGVTSYVLRRTFATVARNDYHAQVNVISVPLGHRSERTTAIYLGRPDCSTVSSLLNKLDKGLQRKSP